MALLTIEFPSGSLRASDNKLLATRLQAQQASLRPQLLDPSALLQHPTRQIPPYRRLTRLTRPPKRLFAVFKSSHPTHPTLKLLLAKLRKPQTLTSNPSFPPPLHSPKACFRLLSRPQRRSRSPASKPLQGRSSKTPQWTTKWASPALAKAGRLSATMVSL